MRRRKKSQKKTFEKQMLDVGRIPNVVAGLVGIFFVMVLSGIPFSSVIPVILFSLGVVVVLQFIIAPMTNKLITKSLSVFR